METENLLITNRAEVRKYCGRSEEEVSNDIQVMKNWLKFQAHLPEIASDNMIEIFLFNNKFVIEKTKSRLDMYYTIRGLMPELYENSNPDLPEIKNVSNVLYYFPLPKLTRNLFRVSILKFKNVPVENFDAYKMLACILNMYEVRLHEDLALGEILIVDCKYLKMGHITKMSPMFFQKLAIILEKVMGNRLKQFQVINYPPFINIVVSIAKSMLRKKLGDRIYLHNSVEGFSEHVPLEILPKDYGGTEKSMDDLQDAWKIKLGEYRDRFEKLDRMRVNESLRPTPIENCEILGYHGNFKKLNVD